MLAAEDFVLAALLEPCYDMGGDAFDYGLLGDALLEQGRLDEAINFYQKMVDMRPGLQAYSRIAYVRWLTGESQVGRFLAGIFGWDPRPSVEQVGIWLLALVPLTVAFFADRPRAPRTPPVEAPAEPGAEAAPSAAVPARETVVAER